MRRLRIGGLFEGYGGLTMAVQAVLGGDLVWYSEVDPRPAKVLAHHHPGVPNLGDITAIDWDQVEPVDVLAGGFPCQDISNAGRQAGIEGERSGLWKRMVDAIRILRPRLVFIENVAALAVRGLDVVLADLAAIGFDAEWTMLRAADVGDAHRRERLFIIAWPATNTERGIGALDRYPEPEHSSGTVRSGQAVFGRCGGVAADSENDGQQGRIPWRHEAERAGSAGHQGPVADAFGDAVREQSVALARRCGTSITGWDRAGSSADAQVDARRLIDRDGRAASDSAGVGRGEGRAESAGLVRGSDAPVCGDGSAPHSDGYRRSGIAQSDFGSDESRIDASFRDDTDGRDSADAVDWGQYAPAIRRWEELTRPAPAPWQISQRTQNRQLSARFTEWLMGIPDGYVTDHLSRNHALHVLGNGVVPQQGAAALRILLERVRLEVAA